MRTRLQTMRASSYGLNYARPGYIIGIIAAAPCLWLLLNNKLSLLFFVTLTVAFTVAWHFNKAKTLLSLIAYLLLLGDIRRISGILTGPVRLDPLLVVGPLLTLYIGVPLLLRVKVDNALSKMVLAFTVILALAILNPRQGPIIVGISGGLFFLIPMFWFWIARAYATKKMMWTLLYRVVLPLGLVAAMIGYYQTYIGFPPWQAEWVKNTLAAGSYTALNLGNGHIRSFGFSVNSAEYGTLLMLSSVLVVAALFRGQRAYALFLPILLPALLLASQRGVILKLLIGIVAIWALQGRNYRSWIPRILLGTAAAVGALIFVGRQASDGRPAGPATNTASLATSHVTGGFAHPLDSRYSTAGTHAQMVRNGIVSGFINPLGSGLGVVTLGSGKFGGDSAISGSSEVDVSDIFTTTGFIGGFLYIFTIGAGFLAIGRLVKDQPSVLSYALVGVLASMLGAWIPLGQYALGPLMWFSLGYLAQVRQSPRVWMQPAIIGELEVSAV